MRGAPQAGAANEGARRNVRDYGAKGDGVTNDLTAIQAAVAALTPGSQLYFPAGSYRVTTPNPAGGAAIYLDGLSSIAVVFASGAELLMDNLQGDGTGGGHGVFIRGGCSNLELRGLRIRWATKPSSRSNGDGIRILGYPSDAAPGGGWTGSTGTCANVRILDCYVEKAPQTGAIILGCTDVTVENFHAFDTWADGLHFNACRRVHLNGHRAQATGDDGLAFVTYYHATQVYQDANLGPFNQPALGDWSNFDSSAAGVVINDGGANGLRVSGCHHITITAPAIEGKASSGIIVDAALTGAGINWAYMASRGIVIAGPTINGCNTGVLCETNYVTSASSAAFWRFDVEIVGAVIRDCTNRALRTEGDGSTASIIAGFTFNGVRASNSGAVSFSSLRDSHIANVDNEGSVQFFGQDASLTGALSTLTPHNLVIADIVARGGTVSFQDLSTCEIGLVHSDNASNDAIVFTRCVDFQISQLHVAYAHRANSGLSRGVLVTKCQHMRITDALVLHDANNTGTWRPLEIGGGDATDRSFDIVVDSIAYRNLINAATAGVAVQGGGFGAFDYLYRMRFYMGGEAIPIWRTEHLGSTTWVERFVKAGTPEGAITAPIGSTCARTDGGAATSSYVKESGVGNTGWIAK